MAEGDIVLYNDYKEQALKGTHDLSADTIKVTLHHGYTPSIDTHAVWADVVATEYGTGGNYTAGGKALSSKTVTQDNENDRALFDAADLTWDMLGPLDPAIPSHAIIRNTTPGGEPLIGYIELGVVATNGGNYTIHFSTNPSAIILLGD